ncbi:homeobox protein cut-like 1 [Amphibalanus amphitrite]|uniref:homeobox protein cut-like 1 n=1 Tax=Amphibalanus amphitrite TaxID=1232801 RepID=UPI001C92874A|nr:homeobox protein cut-like 1 [Amphibalanus amphitrite]
MADDGPDVKNQKKSVKHDSGAADLERVTDYAEEKEISSDITGAVATIGERRRKEAQEKMEREIELARVAIKKDDVELIGAVDTAPVAEAVLQWLTDNKIHHTVFARTVLGWNSAFTPLLRKPVPWHEADQRTRKAYQEMLGWLQRPHQERLDTVREKQDQMNRKRRTESSQKDQRRRRPDAAGPPLQQSPMGVGGLPGEPLPGFGMAVGGLSAEPAGYSEDEFSQPGLPAVGTPYAPLAGGGPTAVAPPSYQDSVVQQQQMVGGGGYQERPPPLYSAPLPGYEELSGGYGAPVGSELTFATQLGPVEQQPAQPAPPQQQTAPLSPPELMPPADGRPLRSQISPLQRRALIDIYHVTARPSSAMRQLIASKLDLPQRTVTNFFSAARTRGIRKQMGPTAGEKELPAVDARP